MKVNKKKVIALLLSLVMIFSISVVPVSAASTTKDYVNRTGYLAPGKSISGTFKLTGWFRMGNQFNVIAGASKANGSLTLVIESEMHKVPCDGKCRIYARESGWNAGTYRYSITNNTKKKITYTIRIYKP